MSQSDTDKYQNEVKQPRKKVTHDEGDDEESKGIQWNKLKVLNKLLIPESFLFSAEFP